ncbi:polyketide hydroxylase [Streptomyces sp. NPDC059385]|uniref:aromatic-ring hydroxylase C-terminal domain-containing protein n=1 Tax=Streptomyces sp. NPDC059385 TaxID=3346817 RepID=UPI00368AC83C
MGHATSHPMLGQWLSDPQAHIAVEQAPVTERLQAARPVLVDDSEDSAIAATAEGWKDRADLVAAQPGDTSLPTSTVLIRPDGYIAWAAAADSQEQSAHHGLREALTTWFGAAR